MHTESSYLDRLEGRIGKGTVMRPIGFSTEALARGDFRAALDLVRKHDVNAVELSALRIDELEPLVAAIPSLNLNLFACISIHAPSSFRRDFEEAVVEVLSSVGNYPVVAHPDVLFTPSLWLRLGPRLLIENMDKRKPIGRTAAELTPIFESLPQAGFCFDIGHARQVDPSMTEAAVLLRVFGHRLRQVHMSEVNTASRHEPISRNAVSAFQRVAYLIPKSIPIVIESLIDDVHIEPCVLDKEIDRAREALSLDHAMAAAQLTANSLRRARDVDCFPATAREPIGSASFE